MAARLLDFFRSEGPWQRRLWTVGIVLGIREVLEGSAAWRSGVLSEPSFRTLCHHTEILAGQDPGVGGSDQRTLLQRLLKSVPRDQGLDWLTLRQLLEDFECRYLERWSDVVRDPVERPHPERTARAIASHLLDIGFSDSFLHRWWTFRIFHEPGERSLAELIAEAQLLTRRGATRFEVLVPLARAPGSGPAMPANWRSAGEVAEWLQRNRCSRRDLRQVGGFLLELNAQDEYAAVDHAAEILERLAARVHLATRSRLQAVGSAWIKGKTMPFPLRPAGRAVEVGAIARENKLYSASSSQAVDAALELLAPLREGPPGPAVAGGWAAIEALLVGPGDAGSRSIAGDRLALLVACSFPRAELTALAYAHFKSADDALARELRDASTNRERSAIVARALSANIPLALAAGSDHLAVARMKRFLALPRKALRDLEQHICFALQRMYRQRNLVLHWGRTEAVCLRAALRTAAPLIGAGVDRIAHAWFKHETSPLELCARATIRCSRLDDPVPISPLDLLECD